MQDPHQSYIKIFNLSSQLQVNHVYRCLAKVVLPAIMAWNTGSRPIYLFRARETGTSISGLKEEHTHNCTVLPEDEVHIEKRQPDATFFPCLELSITMQRAIETATWSNHHEFPVKDVSNLNPLERQRQQNKKIS